MVYAHSYPFAYEGGLLGFPAAVVLMGLLPSFNKLFML